MSLKFCLSRARGLIWANLFPFWKRQQLCPEELILRIKIVAFGQE